MRRLSNVFNTNLELENFIAERSKKNFLTKDLQTNFTCKTCENKNLSLFDDHCIICRIMFTPKSKEHN